MLYIDTLNTIREIFMKILGYDKGEQVLYIEKKDKKFYGEQTDISSTNGNII